MTLQEFFDTYKLISKVKLKGEVDINNNINQFFDLFVFETREEVKAIQDILSKQNHVWTVVDYFSKDKKHDFGIIPDFVNLMNLRNEEQNIICSIMGWCITENSWKSTEIRVDLN